MSAGVPIVPIVIRNAEVISARDSSTLHPGTVDVVVYPPISLDDWTLDDLPERIAEVRQIFVDTLKDWPVGELPAVNLYSSRPPAKKSPAKKVPAKKVPAKKVSPVKVPAKRVSPVKVPAKKVPAKKVPAKKVPAKKVPAKKVSPVKAPAKKAAPEMPRVKGRK
jgi:putative phosphoserine phosphatase/1-acylglycerol-3-phosphate O-acyltransferase